jgi:hypothetical protein
MDTGVYATTAVTTCATATVSCWSVYGSGLPNAPVVALAAAAGMATGDGRFGELRAATYGRGIWQIPLLTAASAAAPAMTLNPASLSFATEAVATASAAQSIQVTNSGNAPLTITQVAAPANFSESDNCVGTAIAVGATCAVQIEFVPTQTGSLNGTLTIYGNVAGGQATASLSGVGAPPSAIVLNPITLNFPSTNVGSDSAALSITISNTGGVTATLQTPVLTGDYIFSANTCTSSLSSNVGCTVSIEFQPTASGTRTGSLSITDSAGTQTASLSGVGVLPATDALAPLSLAFAAQQLNTTSATQQVTLTNTGDAALLLIAAQITSGDFTVVNGCGNSLAGHSTCAMQVAYAPKSVGAETGVLTVSDEYRSQTVALSGSGVAPPGVSLSPISTLAFAPTGVGLIAAAQTVTLTNNGGLALTILNIAVTGDFAIVAGGNSCGASLAAGSACMVQIVFAPNAAAARTGTFTVSDNAASSPQSLQLTGTGVDFALTANGSTTQTVTAGGQAVYPLLLSSAAGVPGTVAFTCAPIPAHATCVVSPATTALGATTPITVTVATSVAGAELHWPGKRQLAWLAMLLPLGLLRLGRHNARRLGAAALLCCVLAVAGCSVTRMVPASSASGGGTGATPTPSGSYNIVVSGTSTGLTRSINLTLIVQ